MAITSSTLITEVTASLVPMRRLRTNLIMSAPAVRLKKMEGNTHATGVEGSAAVTDFRLAPLPGTQNQTATIVRASPFKVVKVCKFSMRVAHTWTPVNQNFLARRIRFSSRILPAYHRRSGLIGSDR